MTVSAADMFETVQAGHILLGDRAYDSDGLRDSLKSRGAWACIKPMPNRVNVPSFSGWLYRQRNAVERFFNKLTPSGQSQPATTSETITSSHPSNSHQSAGCEIMSPDGLG